MQRLSSTQAILYATVIFILTIGMNFVFPGYSIITGGLLLGIFFTIFIPRKRSTVIAAAVSIFVTILFFLYNKEITLPGGITQTIFTLLLILCASFIVTYLKSLYENISFDKNHMTSLFENATEGIILTNQNGNIVLVNPAAEKIFGYQAFEMIGQPIEIVIPAKYKLSHVKLRESFLNAPQDRVMGHGRDLYGTKKNGDNFPVEVSLSYYKRNEESYVIAFIVDITPRKEIEKNMLHQQQELENVTRDIRKLNTQLEAKVEERTVILKEALLKLEQSQQELSEALDKERELNEIKGRFVSMASHEFRTPLSTILSSASLLGKYLTTAEQEKRDKHISRIKESVKNLNNILEDFLSLGRLNEGKVVVHPAEFDLTELIQETTEEMDGLLKKNQSISNHHEGFVTAYSDKNLLKNIMINLITNAIKFSGEGTTISINSFMKNDHASISVADSGLGISKEDQEHLFSSFFRGKNAVNIEGTGLGLHIVKRYMDLLGGEVNVESDLDKGTTITISVPVNHTK